MFDHALEKGVEEMGRVGSKAHHHHAGQVAFSGPLLTINPPDPERIQAGSLPAMVSGEEEARSVRPDYIPSFR